MRLFVSGCITCKWRRRSWQNANNGPNPEYPWQGQDEVIAPADYAFANLEFNVRGMLNMLKFLERCFQIII